MDKTKKKTINTSKDYYDLEGEIANELFWTAIIVLLIIFLLGIFCNVL